MKWNLKMKIEELPNIDIKREKLTDKQLDSRWLPVNRRQLMLSKGYVPSMDSMADSYNIISRLLDDDCVVAYVTDNSQTSFLIKTKRQYVGFISLSKKLARYLSSNSTRKITRIHDWDNKEGFMKLTSDDDLVIADKELWEKYLKTKLLESLGNE